MNDSSPSMRVLKTRELLNSRSTTQADQPIKGTGN